MVCQNLIEESSQVSRMGSRGHRRGERLRSPNTIMNYSNKKVILNISKIIIFAFVISLEFFTINAFSLVVQQDPIGIYCSNGYLIMNGITPDGYIVNERGQWVDKGIVQRK